MWGTVAKYAIQFGMWCLNNPQAVDNGLNEVHTLVDTIHAAKQAKKA